MKRLTFLLAVFAFTFLFSSCGQSGPLYIPGNPSKMAVPPSQDAADDAQQDDAEDNADSSDTD